MDDETTLTHTGVFKAIGKPHLPPGPLMVAEAAASATMLEQDRVQKPRAVGCGCCTGGCVCWMHKPDRRPPVVCAYHKEHGHPHVTEEA
jgi:hypothetical protein